MCECTGFKFDTDYNTTICHECGQETSTGYKMTEPNMNSYLTHTPFLGGYSRQKRFEMMLDLVLNPTPSRSDDGVLEYLFKHKPIKNLGELYYLLKKHRGKDKRYCSVHCFARLCMKNYTPPMRPPSGTKMRVMAKFRDVEFLHKRHCPPKRPFFSYYFLLRRFLSEVDLADHMKYVKKLKCPHRCDVYNKLYKKLLTHSHTDAVVSESV